MHNNYHFLKKLAEELNMLLVGTELLTCFSQEKDEVVLGFSNQAFLKCILKPDFSAVTVVNDFNRARKNSVSLWEELYELKIQKVEVFSFERAIKLVLEQNYTLVIKLFRPNLLIYKDNEQVAIFNNKLLTDKSLKLSDFDRDFKVDFEVFKANEGNYRKLFFTFGKDIFEDLDLKLDGLDLEEKWSKLQEFLKYLNQPTFYLDNSGLLPKLSLLKGEEQPNAVRAINSFVASFQKVSGTDKLKAGLISKLQKDISKTKSYIFTTTTKLNDLQEGVKNEELGNILMANLHIIEEGIEQVELFNFYDEKPIVIKLKKELSPQKNAESYYRKSKNERIEIETAERNLEAAKRKLFKLELSQLEVEEATELKSLRGFSKNLISSEKSTQKDELPFKEYILKGIKVWVGRNAKNNDLLLTQYAQKDDIWLHARDTSGSHVVIKSANPPADVLEYAASLAAYYSKRRTEGLVTVIYTPKKYVRKAKNLAAGQVIVEKEKTLLVEPLDG